MAWIIEDICLTEEARKFGEHAQYKFHVRGVNTECVPPESFAWCVPDVDDFKYDKSRVVVPAIPKLRSGAP